MINNFPLWYEIIDCFLGVYMWIFFIFFIITIFISEQSKNKFVYILEKIVTPLEYTFSGFVPGFLVKKLRHVFIAFILFFFRYYIMPLTINFKIYGIQNLPLEKFLISNISFVLKFFL